MRFTCGVSIDDPRILRFRALALPEKRFVPGEYDSAEAAALALARYRFKRDAK